MAAAEERADRGRVDVRKATYGMLAAERAAPETLRFVTSQVRALVEATPQGDVLSIEASFNALFGDPMPDENKVLKIYYTLSHAEEISEPKILVVPEGSTVLIDARRYARVRRLRSKTVSEDERISRLRSLSGSAAARVARRALETEDVLRLVLRFLPLHPDRLRTMAVCRAWRDFFVANGLAERFSVGVRDCEGVPCYLDLPLGFFEMVLSRSAPHLVVLDLAGYAPITDEVLAPALLANPHLRSLDLSGCALLTVSSLGIIGESCPDLVSLSLKRLAALDDDSVTSVAAGCKRLEILNLSDCTSLTDQSIRALGPQLPRLRVLHAKDLHLVTDESVRILLESCGPRLETLSLWSMHRLSGAGLAPLGGRCSRLASLNLSECFGLDDDALMSTVCACVNLVNLNLMNCHLVTDRTALALAQRLGRLEHLNLRYLMSLTDVGLDALGSHLLRLRSLNLMHCASITTAGVVRLCERLPELSELSLASCEQFTEASVHEIAAACAAREDPDATLDLLDMRGTRAAEASESAAAELSRRLGKSFVGRDGLFLHAPRLGLDGISS